LGSYPGALVFAQLGMARVNFFTSRGNERVEEIIRRLDSGEASLDETLALVSEGKLLIEQCASQLAAVGGALEELRLDELVSRLEREAGG